MGTRIIRVTVTADIAEVVADRMWQWGVRGVEERAEPDGRVTLSTSVGGDNDVIARALGTLDPSWMWHVDDVDDAAGEQWKQFAEPVWCRDDLVVVPSWWNEPIDDGPTAIVIDPGAAFGLGDHPTTRSSMRALADELDRRQSDGTPCQSMLDVGCGTGVLAILGARRGVAQVRAIDISGAAIESTRHNARANEVSEFVQADQQTLAALPIPQPDGYDVIVANILAPTLVALADDLRRLLALGGRLIVSGVLAEGHRHGHAHVLAALAPLRAVSTVEDEGWATVTLTD